VPDLREDVDVELLEQLRSPLRSARLAAARALDDVPQTPDAFRDVLATSPNRVLRERAAIFLASQDVPRGERAHREWAPEWRARIEEQLT
jgi:hypothetical protein